jgi:hypothetical protein
MVAVVGPDSIVASVNVVGPTGRLKSGEGADILEIFERASEVVS